MNTESKKVLVIGANGYIGSSVYNYLKLDGHQVAAVDLCLFGIDLGNSLKVDYRYLPYTYLSEFDVVILFAGNSSVRSCLGDQISSLRNNVENFLMLVEKIKGKKFIYASSSSVYGNTYSSIATEDNMVFTPITTYDLTKQIIDYYIQLYNIEYYGLRFGTVNGYGYSRIVRQDIMINAMVKNSIESKILTCINPEVHRPILDINDLCRGILRIVQDNDDKRGIYNMASFNGTVETISKTVSEICNSTVITKTDKSQLVYDFMISSEKFCTNFNFSFLGTAERIVNSLLENYSRLLFTDRNKEFLYVP